MTEEGQLEMGVVGTATLGGAHLSCQRGMLLLSSSCLSRGGNVGLVVPDATTFQEKLEGLP